MSEHGAIKVPVRVEYTPTTEDVRTRYALDRGTAIGRPYSVARADFDRWLAESYRKAWDAGFMEASRRYADWLLKHDIDIPGITGTNPYKEEA